VVFVFSATSPELGGQELGSAPDWGTASTSIQQVHAMQFVAHFSGTEWSADNARYRHRTGGLPGAFAASLSLPSGVAVTALEIDACDSDAAEEVWLRLTRCAAPGSDCIEIDAVHTGDSYQGGCDWFLTTLASPETINNSSFSYLLEFGSVDHATRMRAVNVFYQRQVSIAPHSATFDDVPTGHWAFRYVEALAASGITAGCGGSSFCPGSTVSRAEMAVFLAKALGLHWPS
jgi:hypothetical protein